MTENTSISKVEKVTADNAIEDFNISQCWAYADRIYKAAFVRSIK